VRDLIGYLTLRLDRTAGVAIVCLRPHAGFVLDPYQGDVDPDLAILNPRAAFEHVSDVQILADDADRLADFCMA